MAAIANAKTIGNEWSNDIEWVRATYDFSVDAGATGVLDIFTASADLIVTHFSSTVKVAPTSGGSATLKVGITGSDAKFMNTTQGAVASLTLGSVVLPPAVEGTPNTLPLPVKLASAAKVLQTIGTDTFLTGKIEYCIGYLRA